MPAILVYGPASFGKSRAIKTLPPKETFIISSDKKDLPWSGWANDYVSYFDGGKFDVKSSNFYRGNDPRKVHKLQTDIINQRDDIKTVIYDTITHMMIYRYMTDPTVLDKKEAWDFYKHLGREMYKLIDTAKDDQKRMHIFIGHSSITYDANGVKQDKVKTIGKLLDDAVDLPSMFDVILFANVRSINEGKEREYYFTTQTDGTNTVRSLEGLFDQYEIPNDYKYVLDKYYSYQRGV